MNWNEIYPSNKEPSLKDIEKFVNSSFWIDFNKFIQDTYKVSPELNYSTCSMQPRLECKI
jgi:hypothetical protein